MVSEQSYKGGKENLGCCPSKGKVRAIMKVSPRVQQGYCKIRFDSGRLAGAGEACLNPKYLLTVLLYLTYSGILVPYRTRPADHNSSFTR